MKSRTLTFISAITLFAALAIPVRLAAQHTRYKLVDIGTFGGPASYVNPAPLMGSPDQVNSSGTTVGGALTSIAITSSSNNAIVCGGIEGLLPLVNHAFQWQNGVLTDLGSLAGPNNCSVAIAINTSGEISGRSENGVIDSVLGLNAVHAVVWKNGQILDLGTLGGSVSSALGMNEHGQVAGFALNAIPDPVSIYDFLLFGSANGTQTRAFLWTDGVMQDLGTLGGPDAQSNFVNDQGQVAGFSYTDSTPNPSTGIPTLHPFLWQNGTMTDLGSLGGTLPGPEPGGAQQLRSGRGFIDAGWRSGLPPVSLDQSWTNARLRDPRRRQRRSKSDQRCRGGCRCLRFARKSRIPCIPVEEWRAG